MKNVKFVSVVDKRQCNGDKRCERLCPAGAIRVIEKKAVVDAGRCVACGRCIDVCRQNAVNLARRDTPWIIRYDTEAVDLDEVQQLCMVAGLLPEIPVCACTGTKAREVAAAIIGGAATPEDIVITTGAGSGCGIYCMGIILKMFQAAGVAVPEDSRWHSLLLTPAGIPEDVVQKYPQYYFTAGI